MTPADLTVLEAVVPTVLTGTPMTRQELTAALVAASGQGPPGGAAAAGSTYADAPLTLTWTTP